MKTFYKAVEGIIRIPRNEPKTLNAFSVFKDCINIQYKAEKLYITKL